MRKAEIIACICALSLVFAEEQYNRALQAADKLQKGLLRNYQEYCSFVQKRLGEIIA